MRDFTDDHSALALNTATLGHNLDGYGAGWSPEQVVDACAERGMAGIVFWRREIGSRAAAIGESRACRRHGGRGTVPLAVPRRSVGAADANGTLGRLPGIHRHGGGTWDTRAHNRHRRHRTRHDRSGGKPEDSGGSCGGECRLCRGARRNPGARAAQPALRRQSHLPDDGARCASHLRNGGRAERRDCGRRLPRLVGHDTGRELRRGARPDRRLPPLRLAGGHSGHAARPWHDGRRSGGLARDNGERWKARATRAPARSRYSPPKTGGSAARTKCSTPWSTAFVPCAEFAMPIRTPASLERAPNPVQARRRLCIAGPTRDAHLVPRPSSVAGRPPTPWSLPPHGREFAPPADGCPRVGYDDAA